MQSVRSKELESRCRLLAERVTDGVRILDHDPSLALYRLQEHVGRSLPLIVQRKTKLAVTGQQLGGIVFDLDNALSTASNMCSAGAPLSRSSELLKECMYLAQQIEHEKSRQEGGVGKARSKSFHGHVPTGDR